MLREGKIIKKTTGLSIPTWFRYLFVLFIVSIFFLTSSGFFFSVVHLDFGVSGSGATSSTPGSDTGTGTSSSGGSGSTACQLETIAGAGITRIGENGTQAQTAELTIDNTDDRELDYEISLSTEVQNFCDVNPTEFSLVPGTRKIVDIDCTIPQEDTVGNVIITQGLCEIGMPITLSVGTENNLLDDLLNDASLSLVFLVQEGRPIKAISFFLVNVVFAHLLFWTMFMLVALGVLVLVI